MTRQEIVAELHDLLEQSYDAQEESLGPEVLRQVERFVMLRSIDQRWVRHLTALDELREGIGLRAYGQRNPLVEYKREAFDAFASLLDAIKGDVSALVLNARIQAQPTMPRPTRLSGATGGSAGSTAAPAQRRASKVGRNDPCPCGSGKKYKNCCLREGLSPEAAAARRA